MPSIDKKAKVIGFVAFLLLLVLTGCVSPFDSDGGRGELTVAVESRQGEPVEEQTVTVRNKETKTVVFEGSTGPDGKIATTLDHGTYVVGTDDKTKTVQLDGDKTISFQIVATPPNSSESSFGQNVF